MYATAEDLALHLGVGVETITPAQINILGSASDIIETFTLGRNDMSKITHTEALKRATLLQYEYITLMPQIDIMSGQKSVASGSMNLQMDTPISELSPRSRRVLFNVGLMYRGVGAR